MARAGVVQEGLAEGAHERFEEEVEGEVRVGEEAARVGEGEADVGDGVGGEVGGAEGEVFELLDRGG